MYKHIHLTSIYKTHFERKRNKGDAFINIDYHTQEKVVHNSNSNLKSLGIWITEMDKGFKTVHVLSPI